MSARWQTRANQKVLTAINCPCNNNPGSSIRSLVVNKTAKDLECKLAKLVTKKRRLGLANQVRLAELELVNLRRGGTPRSTPTIDDPPRHTQARTVSNVNEGSSHKKLKPVKSYQKALEPPQYEGKTHREYLKFICACNQVFDTRLDAYCNNRLKVIYV